MPQFLVRAEAVNFEWSFDDTQDLSTIRGGSFLADAYHLISESPLVQGASQAIWRIDADDAQTARQLIESALTTQEQLQHLIFVVDAVPLSDGQEADIKLLRTLNRWRQFQQPTVAVPPAGNPAGGRTSYCQMDFVRPSTSVVRKGDDEYSISESVRARREYGRGQKSAFYSNIFPPGSPTPGFANDLDDITSRDHCVEPDPLKHLEHKMAVIYFDGNKQSEMAADYGHAKLGEFRNYARSRQEEFLKAVFAGIAREALTLHQSNDWYLWKEDKHLVRFETILWGGDDILLVVPAWKGWSVVSTFFDHVTGKSGTGKWTFDGMDFTYSAGFVLCSDKVSIHRMRRLAGELWRLGKKQTKKEEYENLLGYEVLESFDVASADLDRWRSERLGCGANLGELLLLSPEHLVPVAEMVRAMREQVKKPDSPLSRRQIERLARRMRSCGQSDPGFNGQVEALNIVNEFNTLQLSPVASTSNRQKLHHIAALWDYIV